MHARPDQRETASAGLESPTQAERDRRPAFLILAAALCALATGAYVYHYDTADMEPPPRAELRIDVNAADRPALRILPGIGPTLAQRIVADRADRPFMNVDDLRRVRGIGPKTAEKLTPWVRFGAPQ